MHTTTRHPTAEQRLQAELDAIAPATDSQRPLTRYRGTFYQHIPGELFACGIDDVATFAAEFPGEPVTHANALRLINARLHPLHLEHGSLMAALREADEQFARDAAEARAEDAAMERLWGWSS